jgi:ribonuclease P protein component
VKTRRGAAHRNRIKRRLREAFRRVQVAGGYDIVIRAGTEAATRKFSELERDIDDAMNEAKARAQRASVARTDGIRR